MLLAALSAVFTLAFASVAMAQSAYAPADSTVDCSAVEEGTPGIEFFFVPDAGGCIAEGSEGGFPTSPIVIDLGKVVFDPDTGERLGVVRDLDPNLSNGANSVTTQEFCASFDGLPEAAPTAQEYFEQGAAAEEQAILDPDGDGIACKQEVDYVALGDSFSSGEGVEPFSEDTNEEGGCHRSEHAYAMLLDQDPELNFKLQAFEACSGATTWEVVENQLGAITKDTDLVTITIGGNDVGFAWFVRQCLEPKEQFWKYGGESCEKGKTPYADITANISRLHNGLGDVFEEIRDKIGPDTEVLVVGYPFVVEERLFAGRLGLTCSAIVPSGLLLLASAPAPPLLSALPLLNSVLPLLNRAEQRAAVDVTLALNSAIGDAVTATGDDRFHYISAAGNPPFRGHDMCSGQPYFNDLDRDHEVYTAHPNKKGQAAYAKLIKDYWLEIGNNEQSNVFQTESYPVGTSPDSVTAADLDGDGDADLATANTFSDNGYGDETGDISVLLNEGDGTLAEAVNYPVVDAPTSVAAADLDGDGDIDLASANNFSSNVKVLINEGDGTFAGDANYPVGDRPASVIAADLDGDGDADLATGNGIADNPNSNNVSVLINEGDGVFAEAVDYPVGENTFSVTAADLDGDGDADLVAANANSNNISVLINKGDGEFAESVEYPSGEGTSYATAADLDGDGDADLAAANSGSSDVRVFMNKGDGTFAEAVSYSARAGTLAVTVADLDGDSDLDLAAANFNADNVSILLNKGDGTFADDVTYPVGSYPDSITSSDLDGDGDIDLATANHGSNDVSVLINTTRMGGVAGSSDDSEEANLDQAVEDYYLAAGAEDWEYTYDHLDSQTQSMFTEEEWSQKNQWFRDLNSTVYHILCIEADGESEGSVAEVEVRLSGEDGSSRTRTTYFVKEDGEWPHRFSEEETDLFMPAATFEEFVEAQS